MEINARGLDIIKRCEGLRLEAYLCPAGVWTIGYGHTKGVVKGSKITKSQAEALLRGDLILYQGDVLQVCRVSMNENEFSALVSFCYNVGVTALRKSTLMRLLNKNDRGGAADEFLRWTKGAGRELPGLVTRRQMERALFLTKVFNKNKPKAAGGPLQ